jgi:hypothetical protein
MTGFERNIVTQPEDDLPAKFDLSYEPDKRELGLEFREVGLNGVSSKDESYPSENSLRNAADFMLERIRDERLTHEERIEICTICLLALKDEIYETVGYDVREFMWEKWGVSSTQ